ncbi:hypothetical protein BRADI_4g35075v3 [Brachypodium distachyon]|uniref:Uncharacterized protein n=1 Tax=Brachypodium distachyon TaxID=15368 RepID=A0A2K2CSB4_BRADI|nr:hypothetical protein BRADI_4g35075v3 [Brachypodium distachyon]
MEISKQKFNSTSYRGIRVEDWITAVISLVIIDEVDTIIDPSAVQLPCCPG